MSPRLLGSVGIVFGQKHEINTELETVSRATERG